MLSQEDFPFFQRLLDITVTSHLFYAGRLLHFLGKRDQKQVLSWRVACSFEWHLLHKWAHFRGNRI